MRRTLGIALATLALVAVSVRLTSGQFIFRVNQDTPAKANIWVGAAGTCADETVPVVYNAATACSTIASGVNAAEAGDVVRVRPGTYVATTDVTVNGTAGNTVTLIADGGTVTTCGFTFSTQSYIRIIGLFLDADTGGCGNTHAVVGTGTNTGLEFWHVEIDNASGHGYYFDSNAGSNFCHQCIVVGGDLHDINIGSQTALMLHGNDTFVGYTTFDTVCYIGVSPNGSRNRFLNLNFSNFQQCGSTHPDFYYVHGLTSLAWSDSVVEANFGIGTVTSSDNKSFHAQNEQANAWNDVVWRFNVWHDLGSASFASQYTNGGAGALNRWRHYNNSHIFGDQAVSGPSFTICGNTDATGGAITYYVFNSLFYRCWADDQTTSILPWGGDAPTAANYNLGYDPGGSVTFAAGWSSQANEQSNVNPDLTDVSNDDFTIRVGATAGSSARETGGPLTTAASCSGTTLNVAANTGSFFIGDNSGNLAAYGGALVPGDFLVVNGQTRQVVSRSTDALTLDASTTCSASDPVYFGTSSTIDIGAYPYKAGGYTLTATYSCSGGTCTISPNDAELVRFVICYEHSVPYAVDNASPFTCTDPSGTFEARVYPRYASQTLYATATP